MSYQVGNALNYGVWESTPTWSCNLTLPFDCLNATDRSGNKLEGTLNSVVFKKGSDYYLKIPVKIEGGSTCVVYCDGINAYNERITRYNFLDDSGKAFFENLPAIGGSCSIPTDKVPKYLLLYKENASQALQQDLNIENIRLYTNDPIFGYTYDTMDQETGFSSPFVLYPGTIVSVSMEGSPVDCAFSYVEKLPREGI